MLQRLALIFIIGLCLIDSSWGQDQIDDPAAMLDQTLEQPATIPVTGAAPMPSDDFRSERVRGQLVSRHRVILSSEIPGRITKIPFREGSSFKKGSLLIRLDCRRYQAQMSEAKANLDQASAVLQNQRSLAEYKSTSMLEVTTAENEYRKAQALHRLYSTYVNNCSIIAPFNGTVIQKSVASHQYVNTAEPLLEILNQDALEIEALVPSSWGHHLAVGGNFSINIDEKDDPIKATITRVVPSIDPVSQSIRIFGKPDPKAVLLPGMSGWISFEPTN